MINRWGILIIGFVLCFVAVEIWRNTSVMDQGYLMHKLKLQRKQLLEENGHLQRELSSVLSLNSLDAIARDKLGLTRAQTVRFLEKVISPPERSSPPPPPSFWKLCQRLSRNILGRIKR